MNEPVQDHALEPMPEQEARELEDRLWWIQGRKRIIRSYLKTAKTIAPISRIMDIGCGSGVNFDVLAEFGRVWGCDRSATLAQRARTRGVAQEVYETDVSESPDVRQTDIFTLFDVLEHIEHHDEFVARLSRVAPPKHMLLISVPAYQFLYSSHDRLLHHYRRYSRSDLRNLVKNNGYDMIRSGHFMFFLFPVALLSRLKEKLMTQIGRPNTVVNVGIVPNWLNRVLSGLLAVEARISTSVSLPVGLWLFALARRTDQEGEPSRRDVAVAKVSS